MRQSRLLAKTIKEVPSSAQTASHKFMLRAGYIKQLSAGVYSYLPLMNKTLQKAAQIVREEMDAALAQEVLMPALQPADLWRESGRYDRYTNVDGIMFAFTDRRKSEVCLGPTHEEVVTDIVRSSVSSYRDLPKNLYQIQTKFRDEIRPRFGLMRAREFVMKDAYSFDVDQAGLEKSYQQMYDAYMKIFQRIGCDFRVVEADSGAIGGSGSQEFMVLANSGEDTIIYCDSCDYAANQEKAESRLEEFPQDSEQKPMEKVFGEGLIGVEALADFLKLEVHQTTKTLIFSADGELVAVMVRGDCDVNEIKVANYLNCRELKLATADQIKELTGAEVGYAGPIGLPESVRVLADHYVGGRVNFECGANETNYHNINVNIGRDFPEPEFGDFKLAVEGQISPKSDEKLKSCKGIEVGHIFQLGTKYSEAMGCTFLDADGKSNPITMGCYGIGVSRIVAAVIEQNHDDYGIIWPKSIAPYQVHLVGLNLEKPEIRTAVDELYEKLLAEGVDVLYDDRDSRPGEKFSDADLIGLPIRLTLSAKTVEKNKIEFKLRTGDKDSSELLDFEEVLERLQI